MRWHLDTVGKTPVEKTGSSDRIGGKDIVNVVRKIMSGNF